VQAGQHRVDGFARRRLAGTNEARQIGRVKLPEVHVYSTQSLGISMPKIEHVAVEIGHIEIAQAVVMDR
jgi:hypothetical protein